MARVIQRRPGPPYLLVLFVFLFIVAAALAVLFYTGKDKVQSELKDEKARRSKVISDDELKGQFVKKMSAEVEKAGPGEPKTVLAKLHADQRMLTKHITGMVTEPENAQALAEDAYKIIGSRRGLAEEAKTLYERVVEQKKSIASLEETLQKKEQDIKDRDKTIDDVTAKYKEDRDRLGKDIEKFQADLAAAHQQRIKEVEEAEEKQKDVVEALHKKVAILSAKIDELENERLRQENLLAAALKKIDDLTRPQATLISIARRADGNILKVVENTDICYVSLGRKDRVQAGLSFSIYPRTGIPQDGKGKGKITVT
ncbi:MAG: hypothetical protein KAU28_04745, partial [Phycisphaerae bacterium]|nr:hypothetical protein [Phycisphaerae bacterium]